MALLLWWWACAGIAVAGQDADVGGAGKAIGATGKTAGGACHEGLVLSPGTDCAYPGTDERFRVHADGQAEFLAAAVSGSIDIDGELDSHRYDMAATDLGDGSWRIGRVGKGVEAAPEATEAALEGAGQAVEATGAPIALSALQCSGQPSAGGKAMEIRIEGEVHARSAVSSVTLTGRIEGGLVDVRPIGRLAGGGSAAFALRGTAAIPYAQVGELGCAIDVEYFDIGALRRAQPLRVKWQGRLAK